MGSDGSCWTLMDLDGSQLCLMDLDEFKASVPPPLTIQRLSLFVMNFTAV